MKHILVLLAAFAAPAAVHAHPGGHGDPTLQPPETVQRHAPQRAYGQPGRAENVARTIPVELDASGRCKPASVAVKQGETVKLVARNAATAPQDLAIGTSSELRDHADMLRKFPQMQSPAVQRTRIAAGKSSELVWQFGGAGEYYMSCAAAGAFDAAALAKVIVTP